MRGGGFVGLSCADGGRGPAFDCLGLFLHVQRCAFGRELPDPSVLPREWGHDAAGDMLQGSAREVPVSEIRAGDALLFRISKSLLHVATAIGGGDMLHTENSVGSVIEKLSAPKWQARLIGVYRFE